MNTKDYDELINMLQDGQIDYLQFVLAQEDLAPIFLRDMKERGEKPSNDEARIWITEFENNILYDNK